jgi:WXG100 family type VII secretion target
MADSYGYIAANFGVMEQAGMDLAQVHKNLVATLERLLADLHGNLVEWNSEARDAFTTAQGVWQSSANDMATSLAGFSDFVAKATEQYIVTEHRNSGIWTS